LKIERIVDWNCRLGLPIGIQAPHAGDRRQSSISIR
jgi:hypothetical protein